MSENVLPRLSAAAEPTDRERGNVLATMTSLHALNDFYGLILPPLLPALKTALDLSYSQLGVIPFVGTAVSSFLQPTLGYAADRRRARRVFMVAGFVGYAIAMVSLSLSNSYLAVLFSAVLLGIGSSTYHPQSTTFLVHYFRGARGMALGIHGLGNTVGFLAAPVAVTFLLPRLDISGTALTLALPALVAAAMTVALLREPPMQGGHGLFAGITRPVMLLTAVNGIGGAAGFGFLTWLPSYYRSLDYSLTEAGLLTAAMIVSGAISQPFGGVLSDRIGRRGVLIVALVGAFVFQIAFVMTTSLPLMIALSVMTGFCGSLFPPVVMVYAGELASAGRTGTAVGMVWGLGISISSLSPLLSGFGIDQVGFAAAYASLAFLSLLAAILALRLPR
ncbi:MAG: MFS transporter [Chloroflexota bacterium]|nr:MAG: MFS transporter [Chloroflexota bacterium]